MIDILVVSHACFRSVNRAVYRVLSEKYTLEIVAPRRLISGMKQIEHEPTSVSDPSMHFLELDGRNPRLYTYKGLTETLNRLSPKVIILDNDPMSRLGLYLGHWCKRKGSHLQTLTCENLFFSISASMKRNGWKGLIPALLKNYLKTRVKRNVETVYVISDLGKKIYEKAGFNNVVKLPLGFDPDIFNVNAKKRNQVRTKHNIPSEQPVIAYFGRLVEEKGVHILLKALSKLTDYKWFLFIDKFESHLSNYHQQIANQLKEMQIDDRVIYVEADHCEIAGYMNASDVVVLASQSTRKWIEQYGRVVPEAMACGNLIIVSDSGTPKELIGDCGLVFEEHNVAQLAQFIQKFLDAPEHFDKTRANAAERADKTYTIKSQADVMSIHLNSCLRRF